MGNNILLVGFMGTGKTVVGNALAEALGFQYLDTDDLIVEMAGKTIPEIFSQDGEDRFRDYETEAVRKVGELRDHVIATGGGAVLRDENVALMKKAGKMICLTATPEVIYDRVKTDTYRPLLQVSDPMARIRELLALRKPYYDKADVMIDTSGLSVAQVVDKILMIAGENHEH